MTTALRLVCFKTRRAGGSGHISFQRVAVIRSPSARIRTAAELTCAAFAGSCGILSQRRRIYFAVRSSCFGRVCMVANIIQLIYAVAQPFEGPQHEDSADRRSRADP